MLGELGGKLVSGGAAGRSALGQNVNQSIGREINRPSINHQALAVRFRSRSVLCTRAIARPDRTTFAIEPIAGEIQEDSSLKKTPQLSLAKLSQPWTHGSCRISVPNGTDGWQSGLMHLFTKQTSLKGLRGFESLIIRQA